MSLSQLEEEDKQLTIFNEEGCNSPKYTLEPKNVWNPYD